LSLVPGFHELVLAKRSPFNDETRSARGKATGEQRQCLDGEKRLVGTVVGVKVRRIVVVEEHSYDDAVEPAQLGHLRLRDGDAAEEFLRGLSCQLEVDAVGAQLDLVVPGDAPVRRYINRIEKLKVVPC